jgi:hypothetical protein
MPVPVRDLTTLLSDHVADFSIDDLSDRAIYRSKRMILDSIGRNKLIREIVKLRAIYKIVYLNFIIFNSVLCL